MKIKTVTAVLQDDTGESMIICFMTSRGTEKQLTLPRIEAFNLKKKLNQLFEKT